MPRQKSQNRRNVILPIRLSESERDEICKRAGNAPLSQWIRDLVLAQLEARQADNEKPPTAEPAELCVQTPQAQLPSQPLGVWAKHPVLFEKFKRCVGREPTEAEFEGFSPDSP